MWSCYLHHSEGEPLPRLRVHANSSCINWQNRDSPRNILDSNIYGAINKKNSTFLFSFQLNSSLTPECWKLLISNPETALWEHPWACTCKPSVPHYSEHTSCISHPSKDEETLRVAASLRRARARARDLAKAADSLTSRAGLSRTKVPPLSEDDVNISRCR